MGNTRDEIIFIEKKSAEAFNQKNIQAILEYFDNAIFGFSSTRHDRFSGKEDLRETFEYYLSEGEEVKYEIKDINVVEYDNIAIATFYWRVTIKSGSKVTEIPGRGSHVYRRINGEWRIVHEHFSRAH